MPHPGGDRRRPCWLPSQLALLYHHDPAATATVASGSCAILDAPMASVFVAATSIAVNISASAPDKFS